MFTIEIDSANLMRALSGLQGALGNMQPAMDLIGQGLIEGTRNHIESGSDWWGSPFAPNSDVTLARKRGSQPLIDTRSFISTRLFHQAGGDYVEVGASGVQSAVLQFGASKGEFGGGAPWGDIPARPYLPVSPSGTLAPEAEQLAIDIIMGYIADSVL